MTDEVRLQMARAALAMQINEYGHTSICWRDQTKHGVQGCASTACLLARKVLDIEHLAAGAPEIREALNRCQVDLEHVVDRHTVDSTLDDFLKEEGIRDQVDRMTSERISSSEQLTVSLEQFEAMVDMINNPPPPTPALRRAMKRIEAVAALRDLSVAVGAVHALSVAGGTSPAVSRALGDALARADKVLKSWAAVGQQKDSDSE